MARINKSRESVPLSGTPYPKPNWSMGIEKRTIPTLPTQASDVARASVSKVIPKKKTY